MLLQGSKKLVPTAIRLAKSETGKSIKNAVKNAALKGASNLASDVLKGENAKKSFKKNAALVSSDTIGAVSSIGAKALKRKLTGTGVLEKKSKTSNKNNKRKIKHIGSGFGSLFD